MIAKKNGSKSAPPERYGSACSLSCFVGQVVVAILLLLATIVSAMDLVLAHVLQSGLVFGTSGASLSVIAFAVALTLFFKQVKSMCCGCCRGCCR